MKRLFRSFIFAFNGIKKFFKKEKNARIHLIFAIIVIITGFIIHISVLEWVAIILSIGLVFISEMINTAIEKACDLISEERNEKIKVIKDIAAGAVLISAITAAIVGLIIFLPKLFQIFS